MAKALRFNCTLRLCRFNDFKARNYRSSIRSSRRLLSFQQQTFCRSWCHDSHPLYLALISAFSTLLKVVVYVTKLTGLKISLDINRLLNARLQTAMEHLLRLQIYVSHALWCPCQCEPYSWNVVTPCKGRVHYPGDETDNVPYTKPSSPSKVSISVHETSWEQTVEWCSAEAKKLNHNFRLYLAI